MESELHQTRSLSTKLTLDQILGINGPSSDAEVTGSGSSGDKSSPNPSMRPPTRHGRESVSSNEENKEPVIVENGNGTANLATSSTNPLPGSRRRSEDDFIKKLNEIRRGSLISTMDVLPNSNDSNSNSKFNIATFHSDSSESPKRESRPRLEITVEEVEPSAPPEIVRFHGELSQNSMGSSENEEQSLTFRVEEKKVEKKPVVPKRAPLPKRPITANRPIDKKIDNKQENSLMMQKSMFNSSNSKPSSDAHHKEWLQKKEAEIRAKKLKEKEELAKKAESEKERRENSAKLYQRWVADHDEKMRKMKSARESKEKDRREKTRNEKEEKKREAAKTFEMWKKERSKSANDVRKRAEHDAEAKRNADAAAKAEKEKEARAAFLAWKRQKEEFVSSAARKLREEEQKRRESEEQYSKDFRIMCATEAYETWLEMKDKEREMLADLVLIEAPPIPWIPPSNLVPRHFVKSAHGNRPKTRSQSAKPGVSRSKSRPSTTTSLRPFR